MGKEFWKSKTFWFNVLALIGVVAVAFGFGDFEPDTDVAEYAAMLITLINIALRFITKESVKLK